jgi:hypothetical protein
MAQINKPSDYFNTVTWSGDNTDKTISGVGFQPDWIWWKQRNGTDDHRLIDSVRGEGTASYKILFSDLTDAEIDGNDNGGSQGNINAITSDGFSGVQGTSGWNNWNGSGLNYVGWNWLAGGTGSSNTDGSITSSVSANTTSGFSIVSYTGTGANATVGHGLGVAPSMVIIKNRTTAAQNWQCYHSALGGTKAIELNNGGASFTDSTRFNDTNPTSSVFSIGTATDVNTSSASIIAYCFAEKTGYSKFGSYTGNGNADGPFIYTGFKPAFFIAKSTSGTNWKLFDNKRANTFNPTQTPFNVNEADAEDDNAAYALDFLSNGIKLKNTNGNLNNSGNTMIYMAFAEEPLVGTNNIPATAR